MKMEVLSVDSITKEDVIIIPKLITALSHCEELDHKRKRSMISL